MKCVNLSLFLFLLGIWAVLPFATKAITNPTNTSLVTKVLSSGVEKNVFFSPMSANAILNLIALASDQGKNMYEEMKSLLPDFGYQQYGTFLQETKNDELHPINMGNRIFSRHTDLIDPNYVRTINTLYNTGVEGLNDKSVTEINEWAKNVTKGHLEDVVTDREVLDANLIMLNVIFFEAEWKLPFAETTESVFYLRYGDEIQVKYLNVKGTFLINQIFGSAVVKIPYVGDEYSMVVVHSIKGLDDLVDVLDIPQMKQMQKTFIVAKNFKLALPKFKISYKTNIKEILTSRGKGSLFNENSQINKLGKLDQKTEISQKAGIVVDDIAANGSGKISGRRDFYANRPFLFYIIKESTDDIVFVGTVANPNLE